MSPRHRPPAPVSPIVLASAGAARRPCADEGRKHPSQSVHRRGRSLTWFSLDAANRRAVRPEWPDPGCLARGPGRVRARATRRALGPPVLRPSRLSEGLSKPASRGGAELSETRVFVKICVACRGVRVAPASGKRFDWSVTPPIARTTRDAFPIRLLTNTESASAGASASESVPPIAQNQRRPLRSSARITGPNST